MDNITVFTKRNDSRAKAVGEKIRKFLSKHNFKTDLAVVVGGDGTFLSAVRTLVEKTPKGKPLPPMLGVHSGSLGFLTESSVNGWKNAINKGLRGGFTIEERSMLSVRVGGNKKEYTVLNDVVVNRESVARMIDFDVYYNKEFVSNTKADGVIVSTPTGSTAYSLAAGGPILHPSIPAFVITSISPHTLTNRPIVVADSGVIEVRVKTDSDEILVTLDGQTGISCGKNKRVIIKKNERKLRLIRPNDVTYFNILRNKLSFGKRG
ncbi:MAG: NAD(+)/NADH kinase [Pseudomonadota bacterium]